MLRPKVLLIGLLLLAAFVLVPAVLATPPAPIHGHFYDFVPGAGDHPTVYCLQGFNDGGELILQGCVVQPVKPGLAQKGVFTGIVEGKEGTCEYSLRTFDLDGIARASFNRCTGELAGLHLRAVGRPMPPTWEGTYHFDP